MENQQHYNEIEYFTDVAKIRHGVVNLMQKHNLITKESAKNMNGMINPYFGRIAKTGAIGLEFTEGAPYALHTPYGKVKFGFPSSEEDSPEKAALFDELCRRYGLVEVEPAVHHEMMGNFGPVCAVTRIPGEKGKILPKQLVKVPLENDTRLARLEEQNHVEMVIEKVNEDLIMNGHASLVMEDLTKKHQCIIGNQYEILPIAEKEF